MNVGDKYVGYKDYIVIITSIKDTYITYKPYFVRKGWKYNQALPTELVYFLSFYKPATDADIAAAKVLNPGCLINS